MVTGASTADLALVLVDARYGVAPSRDDMRSLHTCWASVTSSSL
jgi:sulfate adenylyltransferase subunit 1 (EFTu-like GTPase family)